MKFSYSSGQRPLDGFTLKRGIGRGGFGEVYFAISDGGKEVALKLVRGDQEVELRGVAQCLNLKHPNLVGLYDLKRDAQGDHWVVLEYIAGEPPNVVLSRHPTWAGCPRSGGRSSARRCRRTRRTATPAWPRWPATSRRWAMRRRGRPRPPPPGRAARRGCWTRCRPTPGRAPAASRPRRCR